MKTFAVVVLAMMLCQSASAFSLRDMESKRKSLHMANMVSEGDSRRDFFSKTTVAAISVAASGLGFGVMAPAPANAIGGVDKVNAQLKA
jgi:hypothetical protein